MVFLTASVAAVCSSRIQFEVITLGRRDVWSKITRYSKQYLFLSFENSSTVCIHSPGAVLPHQDSAYVLKWHKNCSNTRRKLVLSNLFHATWKRSYMKPQLHEIKTLISQTINAYTEFHVTTWRTFSVPHGHRAKIHLCFSHCTDWAILALFCTETIVRRSSCNELARLKYGAVVVNLRKSFLEEQRSTATVLRMSDATAKTHTASQLAPFVSLAASTCPVHNCLLAQIY